MEKIYMTALSVVPILIGGGLISTAINTPNENGTAGLVAVLAIAILLIIAGIVLFIKLAVPTYKDKSSSVFADLKNWFIPERKGKEDDSKAEFLITDFKKTYKDFFSASHIEENSTLQSTTTQMLWYSLFLKKKRMLRKGITLDFESTRMSYGGKSISKNIYSDSKYTVTDIDERIKALRTYKTNTGKEYQKKNNDLARYSITNARTTTTDNNVICPNCGMECKRDKLLDGCDYCGTKFTVEDLGRRVSSFMLINDVRTDIDKYSDIERKLIPWLYLILVGPCFLFNLFGMLSAWKALEAGIFMKIVATVFGVAFLTVIAAVIARYIISFIMNPIIDIVNGIAANAYKEAIEKEAAKSQKDKAIIDSVKKFDKYFSKDGFLSNVHNKLCAVHFAENVKEAQAFTLFDITSLAQKYKNVIDMDIIDVTLSDYQRDEAYQTIKMRALISLITFDGNRFDTGKEKVDLILQRKGSLKTEALCAPSVFKCKNCGSSLTLLNGGYCEYCGTKLNLSDYDWIISDYQAINY